MHPDGRYGFGVFVFLLRLGRQLACGAHQDSDRVSGVIDLRDTTDFKMNLIMKDFEPHILAHHSGHVHLELGATAHSGSSIRRLTPRGVGSAPAISRSKQGHTYFAHPAATRITNIRSAEVRRIDE